MTNIVIKDLNESREMDREAMRTVAGGCADTAYLSRSPYSTSLKSKSPHDPLQNPFSWASGIVEEFRTR